MDRAGIDTLLKEFKGEDFIYGLNCIHRLPELCKEYGKSVSLIFSSPGKKWSSPIHKIILKIITQSGFRMAGNIIAGATPNAPLEEVYAMKEQIKLQDPDFIISVGGGSSIDATKAAIALAVFEDVQPDLNDYFGMNTVSELIKEYDRKLIPMVAVQVASGSAAHLTKYSNITDFSAGQKLLIIDEAITPPKVIFDYAFTKTSPKDLTMDGAFDGISHSLEVLMGIPEANYNNAKDVCLNSIRLIVENVKNAVEFPNDNSAREALGLGTDLGGYAIMIGGTNGAHLNSFSLTKLLAHGRAVALLNPYYVVFFATAIPDRLKEVAKIYQDAGFFNADFEQLNSRQLGEELAAAMIRLCESVGFPTKLVDVEGFEKSYIDRCIEAAKNPKLESKLKNMPIPLTADNVDKYMRPILEAAYDGDFSKIKEFEGGF